MTYLGIEVSETALLILLAIIAVSLIFIGWKLANPANPATPSPPRESEKSERPIPAQPAMARPEVVIHYEIDIRDEPPLAREKSMKLRVSGGPAFKVQIQDISYKKFVAKFPPISEVTQGENKSVQAEIYHNNQSAGLLRHDFVRILEEKIKDTDGRNPIYLEARVLYEDAKGTKFCALHDIEYAPGAKKVKTSLKRNGHAGS
jgi:hypothetical protein